MPIPGPTCAKAAKTSEKQPTDRSATCALLSCPPSVVETVSPDPPLSFKAMRWADVAIIEGHPPPRAQQTAHAAAVEPQVRWPVLAWRIADRRPRWMARWMLRSVQRRSVNVSTQSDQPWQSRSYLPHQSGQLQVKPPRHRRAFQQARVGP